MWFSQLFSRCYSLFFCSAHSKAHARQTLNNRATFQPLFPCFATFFRGSSLTLLPYLLPFPVLSCSLPPSHQSALSSSPFHCTCLLITNEGVKTQKCVSIATKKIVKYYRKWELIPISFLTVTVKITLDFYLIWLRYLLDFSFMCPHCAKRAKRNEERQRE